VPFNDLLVSLDDPALFERVTYRAAKLVGVWLDEVVLGSGWLELASVAPCPVVTLGPREAEDRGDAKRQAWVPSIGQLGDDGRGDLIAPRL